MSFLELARSTMHPAELCGEFSRILEQLDQAAFSSAYKIRSPLADLAVDDPVLLSRNFKQHAFNELATAQTLEAIATKTKPTPLREEMERHADDEYRHHRMFKAIAKDILQADECSSPSDEADEESYEWILENDRNFVANYNGDIVEFLCDVFAGEARTHVVLSGYLNALQSRGLRFKKICHTLGKVLEDENRHVGYSARYLNEWMLGGLDLEASLKRSFGNFNRLSWMEIASVSQHYIADNKPGASNGHDVVTQ